MALFETNKVVETIDNDSFLQATDGAADFVICKNPEKLKRRKQWRWIY